MSELPSADGADIDEALEDAIYQFDAARLRRLLRAHRVNPNRRVGPGRAPLLHIALDAEVDRGIGDPDYSPLGECFAVLLEAGADPNSHYLGESVTTKVGNWPGLVRLKQLLEDAAPRPHRSD